MLTSIEGVYRDGRIVLNEPPANVRDDTPVIVTFMASPGGDGIELRNHDIGPAEAAELRNAFTAFKDWDEPEMNIYDDYDAAKSKS